MAEVVVGVEAYEVCTQNSLDHVDTLRKHTKHLVRGEGRVQEEGNFQFVLQLQSGHGPSNHVVLGVFVGLHRRRRLISCLQRSLLDYGVRHK